MEFLFDLVTRTAYRLLFVVGIVVLCGVSAVAQESGTNVSGRWIWKSIVSNNKSYIQFRIVIRREGNILRGTYSVDEFVDGRWQGEDGNQTPFVGRLKGSEIQIEFDPLATQPGYEKNVSYAVPTDGRKPSVVRAAARTCGGAWFVGQASKVFRKTWFFGGSGLATGSILAKTRSNKLRILEQSACS